MPQNGDISNDFGVYVNVCCRREIIIRQGATLPDCPNHPHLMTTWNPMEVEVADIIVVNKKSRSEPAAWHFLSGATIKILVVDDEADLTSMLVQWLKRAGHEAFGITGGRDAVQWVIKQQSDAVLLDLVLHDANGLSLIASIKDASPKTKVIVMSGMDHPDLIDSAIQEGASYFFSKPIDFTRLERALRDE